MVLPLLAPVLLDAGHVLLMVSRGVAPRRSRCNVWLAMPEVRLVLSGRVPALHLLRLLIPVLLLLAAAVLLMRPSVLLVVGRRVPSRQLLHGLLRLLRRHRVPGTPPWRSTWSPRLVHLVLLLLQWPAAARLVQLSWEVAGMGRSGLMLLQGGPS